MTHLIYFNIRLIVAGVLLALGGTLLWGIIPSKLRNTIFDNSRKCVGVAMMVMPLSTFLVYFLSLRSLMYNLHITSYLTACYTISILVTVGFVPLLGGKLNFNNPLFKKRFIRGLLGVPIFALPMILANIYGSEHSAEVTKHITFAMLATAMSYQSFTFYKHYREAIRRGNNYYSDDVEVDINWIIRSVIAIFSLEIVCALSIFLPGMDYYVEMGLTIYRVLTITYVFSQFVKFMKNYESMMSVCGNPLIDEVNVESDSAYSRSLSIEQQFQIGKRLEQWIKSRGYTTSGVTIDNVATEVATNRTYLSIYINTTFGCSFKVWITSLRIERAKVLLKGKESAVDIAEQVGFSSPQSFMHSFKRIEGCTPTKWRNSKINI